MNLSFDMEHISRITPNNVIKKKLKWNLDLKKTPMEIE